MKENIVLSKCWSFFFIYIYISPYNRKNIVKSSNDLSDIENVTRSKSNDFTDKALSPFAIDTGKTSANKINSLKIWGRNRLKFMNWPFEKQKNGENFDAPPHKTKKKYLEHERKASYSSSEKSSLSNLQSVSKQAEGAASINPVKLREPSSLRKQRRSIMGHKDEPHSSSGNWSASSESGRASVGSEITIQPTSSASSTSLNQSNLHGSSAPPSSIISRRRFLNTSASSSVTSEGTETPDLQINDPSCYDDETSSAYSCDTEGYYTSFHVDSGLKTLKEEDTLTPMQSTFTLCNANSFESPTNQTTLTAENEYELFGRGSTSTTTSSAGTVCTALMAGESDKSLLKAPDTPERKSSLMKLTRSNSTTSNSTLERSYSSSTVGSTLERTGTIKRNGVLLRKEVSAVVHVAKDKQQGGVDEANQQVPGAEGGIEDASNQHQTGSNLTRQEKETSCPPSNSECSECSDLEGFDRVERIKQKTTINSSRIPSMCIITPTTSDDENTNNVVIRTPYNKGETNSQQNNVDYTNQVLEKSNHMDRKHAKKPAMYPLNNMLEKLRGVLPNIKKHPDKENSPVEISDDVIYDTAGEYVTIADFRNNNNKNALKTGTGVYYSNDIVRRNLAAVLSGNLNQETEYVSLNELPCNLRKEEDKSSSVQSNFLEESPEGGEEKINNGKEMKQMPGTGGNPTIEKREHYKGARVMFDAHGKVIYNSDSLKRRKASHSTFIPGSYVKEPECGSSTTLEQFNYHSYSDTVDNDTDDIVFRSDSQQEKYNDSFLNNNNNKSKIFEEHSSDTTMREDEMNSPLKQHNGPGKGDVVSLLYPECKRVHVKVPKVSSSTLTKQETVLPAVTDLSIEHVDLNSQGKENILKRNNSYRLANSLATHSPSQRNDDIYSERDDSDSSSGKTVSSGGISKSFERLINDFSLSSSSIDSSYLKNKSFENIDLSEDVSDGISACTFPINNRVQTQAEAIYELLKPDRVTVPADREQFRARVMSFNSSKYTDIW